MRTLTVTNWSRWQSYRGDRGQPPWIKVHRALLRNPEFISLTDTQRGHLFHIWILAADKNGTIQAADEDLAGFIQRICCLESAPALEVIAKLGFISLDDNVTPSRRQRDANVTPQSREEESSTETESEAERPAGAPPPLIAPRVCPPKMNHAWCDGRMHVPSTLHAEFQRLAPDGFNLTRWYSETDRSFADQPIGDDAFRFWRARWLEEHGSTTQRTGGSPRAPTQAVDKPPACTCGDAYRNSFDRRCTECDGTPSAAQLDSARPTS